MAIEEKQHAIHFKYCVDRKIRIYPQPIRPGEMKIVVETDGVPKIGTMIFSDNPPTGQISVWDKIRELYKTIYDRDYPKEKKEKIKNAKKIYKYQSKKIRL